MRPVCVFVGIGSLTLASRMGAPAWLLLVLTGSLLFLAVLNLHPDQIDAFNRLIRGHRIENKPRPKSLPPADSKNSKPKERLNQVVAQPRTRFRRQAKDSNKPPSRS